MRNHQGFAIVAPAEREQDSMRNVTSFRDCDLLV